MGGDWAEGAGPKSGSKSETFFGHGFRGLKRCRKPSFQFSFHIGARNPRPFWGSESETDFGLGFGPEFGRTKRLLCGNGPMLAMPTSLPGSSLCESMLMRPLWLCSKGAGKGLSHGRNGGQVTIACMCSTPLRLLHAAHHAASSFVLTLRCVPSARHMSKTTVCMPAHSRAILLAT